MDNVIENPAISQDLLLTRYISELKFNPSKARVAELGSRRNCESNLPHYPLSSKYSNMLVCSNKSNNNDKKPT